MEDDVEAKDASLAAKVEPDAQAESMTAGVTSHPSRPSQYGTVRGARKAGRKALALANAAARAASPSPTANRLPFQGPAAESAVWDAAYSQAGRSYRDRHLLRGAFPELMPACVRAAPSAHVAPLTAGGAPPSAPDQLVLDAGCGHGAGLWPLLRANPRLFGVAFDFSARAVARALAHPECLPARARVFQADVADWRSFARALPAGGVPFALALWTLSALDGRRLEMAAGNLARALRGGGLLCVRDYARGDMREGRLAGRGALVERGEAGDVFRRGDGTIAAFFRLQGLCGVMERAGLVTVRAEVVEREVRNRAKGEVMHRKWIQAVFRRVEAEEVDSVRSERLSGEEGNV